MVSYRALLIIFAVMVLVVFFPGICPAVHPVGAQCEQEGPVHRGQMGRQVSWQVIKFSKVSKLRKIGRLLVI